LHVCFMDIMFIILSMFGCYLCLSILYDYEMIFVAMPC
jgi:hypothetical protein